MHATLNTALASALITLAALCAPAAEPTGWVPEYGLPRGGAGR